MECLFGDKQSAPIRESRHRQLRLFSKAMHDEEETQIVFNMMVNIISFPFFSILRCFRDKNPTNPRDNRPQGSWILWVL